MDTILEKLSSYNILNYIFPGVIFVFIFNMFFNIDIISYIKGDTFINLFIYYFIGMIISRFGSITIETTLRKYKFINFIKYEDFICAENKDKKISVLSEINNMYRTFISLFTIIFILILFFQIYGNSIDNIKIKYLTTFLFILYFSFSYRKQTKYIKDRVKKIISQ